MVTFINNLRVVVLANVTNYLPVCSFLNEVHTLEHKLPL
jgi:hypothetical protein